MTTYLVRLKGQNLLMDGDGVPRKKRFSETRLVEAGNPKEARTIALDLIRNDTDLWNSVVNEVSDLPMTYLESVTEISATAYDAQNRAYAFNWEDEDTEEVSH